MDEIRNQYKSFPSSREKYGNSENNSIDSGFDIDEFIKILKRRKKLVGVTTFFVFSLITVQTVFTRIFKPTYEGTFTLLISDPLSSNKRKLEFKDSALENIAKNTTENDIPTLITLLKSPLLLEDIAKKNSLSYEKLLKNVSIESITIDRRRADGILKVNLRTNNKSKGLKILSDLSRKYLESALQQKQRKISDGLEFLNNQAPTIQNKNRELENKLETFRKKYSLIEPTQEGIKLKEQELEIDKNILELESNKKRLLDVREQIVKGKLTARSFQDIVKSPEKSSGGLVFTDVDQGLLSTLITLETELAKASTKYTKESKVIRGLKKRVEEIRPLFIENQLKAVDIALDLAANQIKTKNEQKNSIKNIFFKKPALIKEFNNLKQRLEISNQNLKSLLSAREKFQLEMAQASFPWRIIADPMMSDKPIKPSFAKNLILGLFYGLSLGVFFALIRDRMDYVFHSAKEIQDDVSLPILGTIPFIKNFKDVRSEVELFLEEFSEDSQKDSKDNVYQRFFYQESLRSFFTSLRFVESENKLKVLAITSSIPKEGKSLLNLLFAKTLSDLGQKVLLIDADLRKPSIHKRLKINNLKGLSNYLTDPNQKFENIIQKCPNFSDFDLVTSGPIPPDSTRLIGGERMKKLINQLRNDSNYDYILLDLPPTLGLSDVSIIGKDLDGIILIIGISYVNRKMPIESVSTIRLSGGNILGVLANNIEKPEEKSLSGGKYGYDYNYKYGYGAYQYTYYEYIENSDESNKKTYSDYDLEDPSNKNVRYFLTSNPFLKSIFLKIQEVNKRFFQWIDN